MEHILFSKTIALVGIENELNYFSGFYGPSFKLPLANRSRLDEYRISSHRLGGLDAAICPNHNLQLDRTDNVQAPCERRINGSNSVDYLSVPGLLPPTLPVVVDRPAHRASTWIKSQTRRIRTPLSSTLYRQELPTRRVPTVGGNLAIPLQDLSPALSAGCWFSPRNAERYGPLLASKVKRAGCPVLHRGMSQTNQ